MSFRWNESMSTGVPTLDEQHKQLIQKLDELVAAVSAGQEGEQLQPLLDFLAKYAVMHFGHEEQCMDQYRCPAAAANRAAHQDFLRIFSAMSSRLTTEGASGSLALEVEQQLMTWVMTHICGVDVKLRPCVTHP